MIAILLCILPASETLTDRVPEIECNHRYCDAGRYVGTQFIFWEYRNGVRVVMDWRNRHGKAHVQRRGTGWRLTFMDGERLRVVDAAAYRETWTQGDPEIEDRYRWGIEHMVHTADNPRTKLSEVPP